MMCSSESADERTRCRYWRGSSPIGLASTSSVIPMMPLSGVRTSWLMLAMNSLLARLAASAASRACASSTSARLRAVTSRPMACRPAGRLRR